MSNRFFNWERSCFCDAVTASRKLTWSPFAVTCEPHEQESDEVLGEDTNESLFEFSHVKEGMCIHSWHWEKPCICDTVTALRKQTWSSFLVSSTYHKQWYLQTTLTKWSQLQRPWRFSVVSAIIQCRNLPLQWQIRSKFENVRFDNSAARLLCF